MASLCLLGALASCITRADRRRHQHSRRRRTKTAEASVLETDVGDDVQIVVVRRRDSKGPGSPPTSPKSALWSPDRKVSMGKNVRWADEITAAEGGQFGKTEDGPEQLLC